jgi:flagellar L-ring protein precursor FlgH
MPPTTSRFAALSLAVLFLALPLQATKKPTAKAAEKQTADPLDHYLTRLAAAPPAPLTLASGSLFTTSGLLLDPYGDVKAHAVGDTLSVQIVESTTIAQSGNVATDREFTHSSALTGIVGQSPSFLNPLLAANSSTKLTGAGSTASQSTLNTTLTALVVAVLPNGLLVVEAKRHVLANQQHENVTLLGVVRPADIASNNSVFSYQLYDLQLDIMGKGVITDTVRQPNVVVRTLLKILSF